MYIYKQWLSKNSKKLIYLLYSMPLLYLLVFVWKNTGKSHIVCSTVCPVCVYVVHMLTTVFYCYCFQITKGSSDDRDANMKELA